MSHDKAQKAAPQAHGAHGAHAGLTISERLFAGAVAGVVECLIMYPLDVVKTLQQLKVGKGAGTFTLLFDLIKREKFGIYRGIIAPLLMEAPKRAIKFAASETYKPYLGPTGAGLGAGITEAFVVVPFELVKIRMQARENVGRYANSMDAVVKIAQQEGPLTFYKGLESTLWRNGVWNAAYFGTIHRIKEAIPVAQDKPALTSARDFAAGVVAGTLATTLNTPFDVAKSRIQNTADKAGWTVPTVAKIASTEGAAALYKGYLPKVLRLGPGGGIMLAAFEFTANWIRKRKANKNQAAH
eukprot:TRINITY_DN992_c0_g1_i1.p1 TRINITY_DN992_c0_g1~~TRINITY_DN992_c0_g1_i1.p1  ORF type:complete len:298 (+),score=100.61 TRINITY_DN992_c0_g1_i1:49-942(+)